MKREIEALLFATDSPLGAARLKAIFPEASPKDLKDAVAELVAEYEEQGHAFTIVEFGGGWQIASRPEYSPLIEKMFKTRRYARLSRAGLEVLAIIAYRQPITRLEVDEIRGVQSSGALATLQERNIVTVVGRSEGPGHPLLYGTTREFLNHIGVKGLGQLPSLPELEDLVENREELKVFASQIGAELDDEDLDAALAAREAGAEESDAEDGGAPDEPDADDDEELADAPGEDILDESDETDEPEADDDPEDEQPDAGETDTEGSAEPRPEPADAEEPRA